MLLFVISSDSSFLCLGLIRAGIIKYQDYKLYHSQSQAGTDSNSIRQHKTIASLIFYSTLTFQYKLDALFERYAMVLSKLNILPYGIKYNLQIVLVEEGEISIDWSNAFLSF